MLKELLIIIGQDNETRFLKMLPWVQSLSGVFPLNFQPFLSAKIYKTESVIIQDEKILLHQLRNGVGRLSCMENKYSTADMLLQRIWIIN